MRCRRTYVLKKGGGPNFSSSNLKYLSVDQQLLNGSTFLMDTKTDKLTELHLIEVFFSDEGILSFNIYFILRFGLANSINNYLRLIICVVCGRNQF